MNISISVQGFELTAAIDSFVRNEIRSTLRRFSDDVVYVDVFIKDTNGPKGGMDKQVLIRVQMRGRQSLALQTTRVDLYAAVKISSKRAKRAVRRSLRKTRRFNKLSARKLAPATVHEAQEA